MAIDLTLAAALRRHGSAPAAASAKPASAGEGRSDEPADLSQRAGLGLGVGHGRPSQPHDIGGAHQDERADPMGGLARDFARGGDHAMAYVADLRQRLEGGARVHFLDVPGPVRAVLIAAGWAPHRRTGELIRLPWRPPPANSAGEPGVD